MVDAAGGRGAGEAGHELIVVEEISRQRPQVWVLNLLHRCPHTRQHLAHVLLGGGEHIRQVVLVGLGGPDLFDDDLPAAQVLLHLAQRLDHLPLLEGLGDRGRILPHPRQHLAGAVGQDEGEELAPRAVAERLQLLAAYQEEAQDTVARPQVAHELSFHSLPPPGNGTPMNSDFRR